MRSTSGTLAASARSGIGQKEKGDDVDGVGGWARATTAGATPRQGHMVVPVVWPMGYLEDGQINKEKGLAMAKGKTRSGKANGIFSF